jgi:endonuclease-3
MTSASRLETLVAALSKFYGALPARPRDPFRLFVWEVLSVHSTPRKRDAAFSALKRIPALTPDAMWRAPQKKLQESVALAGAYAEQRLHALRRGADIFRRTPQLPSMIRGPLPAARRVLKPLPQLGETGAHRMLLFAADQLIFPVDARVNRVARRLGYGDPSDDFRRQARSVQQALIQELTPSVAAFQHAFVYLSHHGSSVCTETEPHCTICPLQKSCPEGLRRLGAT